MPVRRIHLLVAAAAINAALTGCSQEPANPEQSVTPGTGGHGSFAQCLHEHGVDESAVSPAGPPAGVDPGTWQAAMQACNTLAPGPAPGA